MGILRSSYRQATRLWGRLRREYRRRESAYQVNQENDHLPDDSIHTVVIGLGSRGRQQVFSLSQLNAVNLVGFVDPSPESQDWANSNYVDTPVFSSVDELFKSDLSVDLATVASSTGTRLDLATTLVDNGVKKIMVEKPLTDTLEKGQTFVELARTSGVSMTVDNNRRWSSDYAEVKQYLESGSLGRIQQIRLTGGKNNLGSVGFHFIDIFNYLLNQEPRGVTGTLLDSPTQANNQGPLSFSDVAGSGTIFYEDQTVGVIDLHPINQEFNNVISIRGSDGFMIIDESQKEWVVYDSDSMNSTRKETEFQGLNLSHGCFMKGIIELASDNKNSSTVSNSYKALEIIFALHASHRDPSNVVELPLEVEQANFRVNFR